MIIMSIEFRSYQTLLRKVTTTAAVADGTDHRLGECSKGRDKPEGYTCVCQTNTSGCTVV